jgi:hypothetical protein
VTSTTDFRKFAEQCLDMAERGPPGQRQALLKMAEAWLELATAALPRTESRQTAPSSDELQ